MTSEELAKVWEKRAAKALPEFQKTMRGIGVQALAFCRKQMTTDIYAKPVPRRPRSGKPMWTRTGNLRRSERIGQRDPFTVTIVNDADYALPRHEMGKPGHRPTRYPAHWRDELLKTFQPILAAALRRTVQEILKD